MLKSYIFYEHLNTQHTPMIPKTVSILILIVTFLLLVAGCGTQPAKMDNAQLLAATQQIALEYAASNDLAKAQTSLAALTVANPNQWLVYVAESTVNDVNASPELVTSLIKLADASGLRSPIVEEYAVSNNLRTSAAVAAAAPPAEPAVEQAPQPAATATNPSADPAVATPQTENPPPAQRTGETAPTATPALAPVQSVSVLASTLVNVRSGPGTNYDLSGTMQVSESANVVAKNSDGTWWQVRLTSGATGWVFAELVQASGPIEQVAVAADIPVAPTAAPIVAAPATNTPASQAAATQPPPAAAQPTATTAPPAAPVTSGPQFVVIEKRLWGVEENGGQLAGESVNCGLDRRLDAYAVDAAGNPINGVAIQAIYGNQEIYVTGDQGKGDGKSEFVLGEGQGLKVVKFGGQDVTSQIADGMSTNTGAIPFPDLIQARYCTNDDTCRKFVETNGCTGHYSWTVKFKKNY